VSNEFLLVLLVAAVAALASPFGGLVATWRAPSTLVASAALGFASGVLIGAVALEMVPEAIAMASLALAVGGFAGGVLIVWGIDLYVHRGMVAGRRAQQRRHVESFYALQPPRGDGVTVLALGTGLEEVIEGAMIGVGMALSPGLAVLIGLAITLDNLSEGMSIGHLLRDPEGRGATRRTILLWTSAVGGALFVSAVLGWLTLQGLSTTILGTLLAAGAGGILYLTVTELVPNAHERHFQQSGALAAMIGFVVMVVLADLV
jgi:zinc transporter, ZIP family